ncbi:MAG: hypothetical protein ACYDBJ_10805 [Aggregatilineales bacterium]
MATKLLFKKNGKPVEAGLEVTIQWDRSWLPFSGGTVRSWTDGSGCVYIEDCLLRGGSRKTETISIRSPGDNYTLIFVGTILSQGEQHVFLLEAAQRERVADTGK